ncbi:hypothetical protein G5714_013842 [Onychostoma macrolepis]|uniref:Uncharacterized protein n=1 Tax=Onychostoma macrolepis TaxID=369639 RepID=A0A7J6CG24_9TELE|nr:hypothetical protein G5714_013842 [Onychostoma macrolepis]
MATKRPDQTLPFRLYLFDTVSLDLLSDAGERNPGQTTLPFQVPRWRRLLVRHSGYCAPVGRRQEPPSQTTYRFILRSARLTRLTRPALERSTLLSAVDLCFKAFYVFDVKGM